MTLKDALVIGLMQCIALVPGVSRSGATISAGLFRGLNRVAATRFSFFLAIPALIAAGGFEAATSAKDICRRSAGADRRRDGDQLHRRVRVDRLAAAHRREAPDLRLHRLPGPDRRARRRAAARRPDHGAVAPAAPSPPGRRTTSGGRPISSAFVASSARSRSAGSGSSGRKCRDPGVRG